MASSESYDVVKLAEDFTNFVREKSTRFLSPTEYQSGLRRIGSYAIQGEVTGLPFDGLDAYRHLNALPDGQDFYELRFFFEGVKQKEVSFEEVDRFSVCDKEHHEEFSGIAATKYAGWLIKYLQDLDLQGRFIPRIKTFEEEF